MPHSLSTELCVPSCAPHYGSHDSLALCERDMGIAEHRWTPHYRKKKKKKNRQISPNRKNSENTAIS